MPDQRHRRSYSKAFKCRIVAETLEPGASVAGAAPSHGLNANMIFLWCRDPRFGPGGDRSGFLPVEISEPEGPSVEVPELRSTESRIEIVLRSGHRLVLGGSFDPDVVLRLARGLAQS